MRFFNFSVLALALALTLVLAACAGMGGRGGSAVPGFADGEYEGMAQGYRGTIHVRVQIDQGTISWIEILESSEDRFVGSAAIEEMQALALAYNTPDIDAVSGATESSEGFLAALSNALENARTRKSN